MPGPARALRRGADARVGECGDDGPNALGESPGAVQDGGTGAGLRRRHGGRVPGRHQRFRVERGGRVVPQPAGVVRHGGQGVGERVTMRPPTADREQQDQQGLRHAPERDDPGVLQGPPDARGQGDGHQHAADRRRRDDPGGRSDGPRHPCGKGPYGQQWEERRESPRGQIPEEGAECQTYARAERDDFAGTPGALERGCARGVGAEGGGRGVRRGGQPQRRPDDERHPHSCAQREQGLKSRLLDREPGSHEFPEGPQPRHGQEPSPAPLPGRAGHAAENVEHEAGVLVALGGRRSTGDVVGP